MTYPKRLAALSLTLELALHGCITPEISATSSQGAPYRLRCEPRADLRSQTVKVVSCVFANSSDAPLSFKVREVSFAPASLNAGIASPKAIAAYRDSFNRTGSQDDSDKAVIIGALVLGVAIAAGSKGSGGAASNGAVGAAVLGAAEDPRSRADYSAEHLLGPAFSLPAGGHATRLLLVETPFATQRPEAMSVCLEQPVRECLTLSFGPSSRARVGSW